MKPQKTSILKPTSRMGFVSDCMRFLNQFRGFQLILSVFLQPANRIQSVLRRTSWDFQDQFRGFRLILSVFWHQSTLFVSLFRTSWVCLDQFRGFQLILCVFFNPTCRMQSVSTSFPKFSWMLTRCDPRGMQGGGAEPRFYDNAIVFSMRGFCEVLAKNHERPSQEEKNEKRYLAFPMIKNLLNAISNVPAGRAAFSLVFIDFHWFPLEFSMKIYTNLRKINEK